MRFAKKEHPVDENKNGKLDRWELEDRSRIICPVAVAEDRWAKAYASAMSMLVKLDGR